MNTLQVQLDRALEMLRAKHMLLHRLQWSRGPQHYDSCPLCGGGDPADGRTPEDNLGHQEGCEMYDMFL